MVMILVSSFAQQQMQCVAVCCSVLQCAQLISVCLAVCRQFIAVCCSVLQCVAMCCSVLQCVAVCCSVLQCVYDARSSSFAQQQMQSVAGVVGVLQCVAVFK